MIVVEAGGPVPYSGSHVVGLTAGVVVVLSSGESDVVHYGKELIGHMHLIGVLRLVELGNKVFDALLVSPNGLGC